MKVLMTFGVMLLCLGCKGKEGASNEVSQQNDTTSKLVDAGASSAAPDETAYQYVSKKLDEAHSQLKAYEGVGSYFVNEGQPGCLPADYTQKMDVSRSLNGKISAANTVDTVNLRVVDLGKCEENDMEHRRVAALFPDSTVSESNENCKTVAWNFSGKMPYGVNLGIDVLGFLRKIPQEDVLGFFSKDSNMQTSGKIETKSGLAVFSESGHLIGWRYSFEVKCGEQ